MFENYGLLDWLGFADWADKFLTGDAELWTFADLVFETIPAVLRLCVIIFILNWIMSIIADTVRSVAGGYRR